MDRSDLLRNLVLMAAADGSFTQEEIQFLSDRAEGWGIPSHELARAIEHVLTHEPSLSIPAAREERIELLEELIRMVGSDGHLAEAEKQLLAVATASMNISVDELNRTIDKVVNEQG